MQDETQKRKVNYCLYPTPRQAEALGVLLRSHQQLYNAALEERISAWKMARKSISYANQCASLTEIRRDLPEWAEANCSSQQMTLRRLDKAFSAFFRRVQKGETPGFPRFKSLARFPGFSFKSHGDGWRFTPGKNWKHGSLRLSGVGHVTCRGKARLQAWSDAGSFWPPRLRKQPSGPARPSSANSYCWKQLPTLADRSLKCQSCASW